MASRNRSKNNNPEGRNQHSGWMGTARDKPLATAAVAAATVGAGVFLWSKRNQISEQISNLSDQISDWSSSMNSGSMTSGDNRTQEEISQEALTLKETGRKSRGSGGPAAQQDFQSGMTGSNQEMKAGAKAFS